MTNPFKLFSLDTRSSTTLAISIAAYKRMLMRLSRFSDGSQIQSIRAQVRHALAEWVKKAEKRMLLLPSASKKQPAMVPAPRVVHKLNKPR